MPPCWPMPPPWLEYLATGTRNDLQSATQQAARGAGQQAVRQQDSAQLQRTPGRLGHCSRCPCLQGTERCQAHHNEHTPVSKPREQAGVTRGPAGRTGYAASKGVSYVRVHHQAPRKVHSAHKHLSVSLLVWNQNTSLATGALTCASMVVGGLTVQLVSNLVKQTHLQRSW